MGLALVHCRAGAGVQAPAVRVEVDLSGGLPAMHIVGLPEAAVRESRDRVRAALLNSQFEFPAGRITVNLAPADLPKDGSRFDLAIALGILAASGQIDRGALDGSEFIGELGLTGELRGIDGILPAALAAARTGHRLYVAAANAAEAALARKAEVLVARTLLEVCAALQGRKALPCATTPAAPTAADAHHPDLADVRGQAQARRALEIAAAGGHHLLLIGSPGCGKSLLAARLPGLLPEADEDEALETAAVTSISGLGFDPARWRQRPFRHPHHSASAVALVGGGNPPRPGEISLAHNGVLFLDELPEWSRAALEALREPLESGQVTIARAAQRAEFPARFQLVAAMNPCPCGWAGDSRCGCHNSPDCIQRYRSRISGPLLDRIDLQLEVPRLPPHELRPDAPPGEDSASVRARVERARGLQLARAGTLNAHMDPSATLCHCRLAGADQQLLEKAAERLHLSARTLHRLLRVARTIADLAGAADIATPHLTEALGYRGIGPADARHAA